MHVAAGRCRAISDHVRHVYWVGIENLDAPCNINTQRLLVDYMCFFDIAFEIRRIDFGGI